MFFSLPSQAAGAAWGLLGGEGGLGLAPAVNSYYTDQRSYVHLITELKNEGSARLLPTMGINSELR